MSTIAARSNAGSAAKRQPARPGRPSSWKRVRVILSAAILATMCLATSATVSTPQVFADQWCTSC